MVGFTHILNTFDFHLNYISLIYQLLSEKSPQPKLSADFFCPENHRLLNSWKTYLWIGVLINHLLKYSYKKLCK